LGLVDSEIGEIGKFNRRESTMLGDHFLPDGFELIYASADVGQEYPHNKLLRICDRTSCRVKEYIAENEEVFESIVSIDSPFFDGMTTVPSDVVYQLSGHET